MPNLSIKDVPEAWAEALRQRAARNHRSLQGELMALVEQAVKQETEVPTSPADPANPGAPRIVGLRQTRLAHRAAGVENDRADGGGAA